MILDAAHPAAASAPAEPIVLPTPASPARRPPLPIVAAVVPIGAAVVMWLVTGSLFMLLFAALGPLIAVASIIDGAHAQRRERRRSAAETAAAVARATVELGHRHDHERGVQQTVHPDAGRLLQRPADLWRPAAERGDTLVVGAGDGVSAARVIGGGDSGDAAALRAAAGTVQHVPVAIPVRVGVCVVGARVVAMAVARALVLQLCLVHPPERLAILCAPPGEDWAAALPHRAGRPSALGSGALGAGAPGSGALGAGPLGAGALRLAFAGPGQPVPDDADVVIAVAATGAPVPLRCGAVLTVAGADTARFEHGAHRRTLTVEAVSALQAEAATAMLAGKAPAVTAAEPEALRFADLTGPASTAPGRDHLAVPIGTESGGEAIVDLVGDGPHAVVAGVTGSGKSELMITWIVALCASRPPSEVCFLLADFKGGTAFDSLAQLPHVTGVLTDLDGTGARRALESLRAELRRREAELMRAGARDIRDEGVQLPRLVIVVDEFAAVLSEHPELRAVFTDVAARGRALGMHLILGTQRVAGVVRDALLANCPLRISLRVTDPADSRAVIGSAVAAQLPGGEDARGLAYVRRAADADPRLTRIALTTADDVAGIAARTGARDAPHAPWLPALPARIPLEKLRAVERAPDDAGRLVLGVADEPHRQRQPIVELVIGEDRGLVAVGAARSGKSTLIELLAGQAESALRIAADPVAAWDSAAAAERDGIRGGVLLIDDVDALALSFPPEYAAVFLERMERIVRAAGASGSTVVMTAQRLAGPVARIADLLPLRAILPMASRIDHVSAGGEPAAYDPAAVPGRARLAGRLVQFATPPNPPDPRDGRRAASPPPQIPVWTPRSPVTAVVSRPAAAQAAALTTALPDARVRTVDEPAPGILLDELHGSRTILVGDPDGWQRHWSLFCRIRAEHDVVVSTACAADFRALTGRRELPPYTVVAPQRSWLVPPSGEVSRIVLPG
ncbi:MAG TPA: FtsK/SpoIIIE domain-containing protein [Microbacterium sp.]|nr:FtsK/SpoIIIE domain-containing protein [Microbacterium sp.]